MHQGFEHIRRKIMLYLHESGQEVSEEDVYDLVEEEIKNSLKVNRQVTNKTAYTRVLNRARLSYQSRN